MLLLQFSGVMDGVDEGWLSGEYLLTVYSRRDAVSAEGRALANIGYFCPRVVYEDK